MRRVVPLVVVLLALSACTPATTPPSPSPNPQPVTAHTLEPPPEPTSNQPSSPPPADPPPKGPEELRLEFHVAASRSGPWTPYFPGVHVDGSEVWVKIEANHSLPKNVLERFTN